MSTKRLLSSLTVAAGFAAISLLSVSSRRAAAMTPEQAAGQGAAAGAASGVNETKQLNEQTASQQQDNGGDSGSCA